MHLLISAWDEFVESELEWLGLAAQALETHSILTGPLLDPTGDWEPGDAIQVVPDDLALESMSEAFQALTTDYRLCLLYRRPGDRHRRASRGRRRAVATVAAAVGGRGPMTPSPALASWSPRQGPSTSCTGWRWRSSRSTLVPAA